MTDRRRPKNLTPEEEAKAIAEASQADERAKIATFGSAAFGLAGIFTFVYGLVWQENIGTALTGAVIGFVALGIITVVQAARLLGKDGNG